MGIYIINQRQIYWPSMSSSTSDSESESISASSGSGSTSGSACLGSVLTPPALPPPNGQLQTDKNVSY